jgi:hypothetical protein
MKAFIEEIDIPLIADAIEVFKEYVKNNPDSYFNVKQIESFKEKYPRISDYINPANKKSR